MAHEEAQDVLKNCHLLCLPSIREFGGGVVLEAMALGVPPLIVDYAGPGELVKPEWGMKVPLGSRDEIIEHFRQKLEHLSSDRSALDSMSIAGAARIASHFTWERKAEQVLQVYEWARTGGEKQRFF